jgi:excisionase family DNA binding protein
MLDYISVQQASDKWEISKRRIQKLCEENRINGAVRFGRAWAIPKDAEKPLDARLKTSKQKLKNN